MTGLSSSGHEPVSSSTAASDWKPVIEDAVNYGITGENAALLGLLSDTI